MATSRQIQTRCDHAQRDVHDDIHDGIRDSVGGLSLSGVGLFVNYGQKVLFKKTKIHFSYYVVDLWR